MALRCVGLEKGTGRPHVIPHIQATTRPARDQISLISQAHLTLSVAMMCVSSMRPEAVTSPPWLIISTRGTSMRTPTPPPRAALANVRECTTCGQLMTKNDSGAAAWHRIHGAMLMARCLLRSELSSCWQQTV